MRAVFASLIISLLLASQKGDVRAGEKKADWVPVPQLAPAQPPIVLFPKLPRPGTMEMWQYYGVDRLGRVRPRVILSPDGAYDSLTKEPYPWLNNRTSNQLPTVLGAPGAFVEPAAQPFIVPEAQVVPAPTPMMPYAPRLMPYTVD